jgi:large subunit ribosomal protein L19
MNVINKIEAAELREVPDFKVGDTGRVHFKIVEGKNERIQVYEGLVLSIKNSGVGRSFMVRKNSYGVGVERVFPVHSPRIDKLEIVRYGKTGAPSFTISATKWARSPRSRSFSAEGNHPVRQQEAKAEVPAQSITRYEQDRCGLHPIPTRERRRRSSRTSDRRLCRLEGSPSRNERRMGRRRERCSDYGLHIRASRRGG